MGKDDSRDEGDSDDLLYEVIEVRLMKGGDKVFDVRFEGCSDCIDVESKEMVRMLKQSTFVKVSDNGTEIQET